jgi:hypothetical protein
MTRITSHVVNEDVELLLLDGVPVGVVFIGDPRASGRRESYPTPEIAVAGLQVRGTEGDTVTAERLLESSVTGFLPRYVRCEVTPKAVAAALYEQIRDQTRAAQAKPKGPEAAKRSSVEGDPS